MKTVSGSKGLIFILIEDTALLIILLMDKWATLPRLPCFFLPTRNDSSSHFPMLSSEQVSAVISHTSWYLRGTCPLTGMSSPVYLLVNLHYVLHHSLSFTSSREASLSFSWKTLKLLFFFSLSLLLLHTFTRKLTPSHSSCFQLYLLLYLSAP